MMLTYWFLHLFCGATLLPQSALHICSEGLLIQSQGRMPLAAPGVRLLASTLYIQNQKAPRHLAQHSR